nr:MAG TPA: hypothetical protein [Caudoviricetes sp.]
MLLFTKLLILLFYFPFFPKSTEVKKRQNKKAWQFNHALN